MLNIQGENIFLRALEPEDLDVVHEIENTIDIWELSHTQTPYSRFLIKEYLENVHKDIYEIKQLRLAICDNKEQSVLGLIDLFDFDPKNKRVGVGIVLINPKDRGKGYGSDALKTLIDYAFTYLNIHQMYCNIGVTNKVSIQLFEKQGFTLIGNKKDWNYHNGSYSDELIYQLIKHVH